jgi:hypothetical protein
MFLTIACYFTSLQEHDNVPIMKEKRKFEKVTGEGENWLQAQAQAQQR